MANNELQITESNRLHLADDIEWSNEDIQSVDSLNSLYSDGCGCTLGSDGESCISGFTIDRLAKYHFCCIEMERERLDATILGIIGALTLHDETGMKRNITVYRHGGRVVCRKVFLQLHGIGKRRLEYLHEHYKNNGLDERQHGNKRRLPANTTTKDVIDQTVAFLGNHGTHHGLCLPGRVPGHRFTDDKIGMLPSHHSKSYVHRKYEEACKSCDATAVSSKVFSELWQQFLPYMISINPRSDLCFQCQENNNLIIRSVNCDTKETYTKVKPDVTIVTKVPNSLNVTSLYSFDFAKKVLYPANPDQPGSIYFLVPRRCSIFGVNNEALNRQTNYLIDEAVDTGKGANYVISYLDYYLKNYGIGEKIMHLQADNCPGQNKNNAMLFYLCWRVINGLHSQISYNFMIKGHTKFSVDRCFGAIKKKYSRAFCSSLSDIADPVNTSTEFGTNLAQLVGLPDETVIVKVYDWTTYLKKYFNNLIDISKSYNFRFNKNEPGVVYSRLLAHSAEVKHNLLINESLPKGMPEQIIPKGLTQYRKEYLFREIRKYVPLENQDSVAPKP